MTRRIDTHQHIVPPFYAQWLERKGLTAGGLPIPRWSAEAALEMMEALHIAAGVLSVSTPGVHLGDDAEARSMARAVNEFSAQVAAEHPGRFGFFATLTLPDVEGAIAEAAYALDNLKADGVVLLTNVRGTYLGDASMEPLMEELNRRQAVVFVHPSELPAPPVPGIPPFAADFLLDTTRAAINMAKAGWLARYPDLKIILSHAGGFVPYAAERFARLCAPSGRYEDGVLQLQRFWFDTALSSSPYALAALLAFADPGRITFGSDWPYAPQERSAHFARLFEQYGFDAKQREAIERGNALRLFPRFG
ncbi:amidohydrolase [Ramlibacter sp. G-1-2-2]|uniref:Amidohydrolase n=1 Tax=Ramlibacter agri TaxID=2728837 RepID=A0A848HAW0_9BURK|nr:amidohydrolase family protein [Ramlibacter agri]NML47182.1 amidohydrolase [Ramlibacter agri]